MARHVVICSKFEEDRSIRGWVIDNLAHFCPCYVMLWPWPLTLWSWTCIIDGMWCDQAMYQMWPRLNTPQLSYSQFGKFLLALRLAVTFTFDPLTLNFCGKSGIKWSAHTPNLSDISQSAAELLTINYRFFVRFRGYSNTARDDFKNAWTDLHQTW